LPDGWIDIVEEHVAVWRLLNDVERARLEKATDWLLRRKHWEASQGFALVDEITVTIAVQAALLISGLSVREYRGVGAIIVYPTAMRSRGVYEGPVRGTVTDSDEPVVGEAHDGRGDSWIEVCTDVFEAVRAGAERPPLDPYGATSPAEFFAVATEAFFDVPAELEQHEPRLYESMRNFYRQDPAARARREP
jgi:Mlc titration factor MtfA (ptsG expression regulator)